jgi:hypothetical protein
MNDSGQDLILEFRERRKALIDTVTAMKYVGRQKAKAENVYRKELCKKILIERNKGTPVTIISDVCRGDDKIADLKMERDIKETDYEVCEHMVNAIKLEIRLLEGEIQAERQG